jgi:hypothetical protein
LRLPRLQGGSAAKHLKATRHPIGTFAIFCAGFR